MIREMEQTDLSTINIIGSQIKNDFVNKYSLDNLNKNISKVYVYEQNNQVIGFIQIDKNFEVLDIVNIAVDINNKRQGIASKLIEYVINNFEIERIMLEVRSKNIPAIKLYESFNFKVINVRKNYYGDDDALVMEMIK